MLRNCFGREKEQEEMAVFRRVYAEGHPYFITMTTRNRTPLLVNNVALLREAFRHSKEYFAYNIDSICDTARSSAYDHHTRRV